MRDAWFAPVVLLFLALILGLQWTGGAYSAEFNSHPDEASHLVSGLMVHDYIVTWPPADPIPWAARYYLHYPKVGIGHWPPGFYILEALWWLVFPPSRTSAMLLNAAMAWVAAIIFYLMARKASSTWLAVAATVVLLIAPVTQESFDASMADLPCVLWSVVLMYACVRLVESPSARWLCWAAIWITCALLTKGSGACLVAVPFLALWITGTWRSVRLRWLFGMAAIALPAIAWYAATAIFLHQDLPRWAGSGRLMPWPMLIAPGLAGYGFLALACVGIYAAVLSRRPAALVAVSVLVSTAASSVFLRAMAEHRHLIIVLPAILLLAMEALLLARKRPWVSAGLALVALILFPFRIYRQQPEGFTQLLTQVKHPARMLVSSNGTGEGPWIAEVALAEKRPSSVVVRATKSLASSGWNNEHYRLTVATEGDVQTRLDELGIELVVMHSDARWPEKEHHNLLLRTLQQGDAWRTCGAAGDLAAYCRTRPPSVPLKPLSIDLRRRIGQIITE